MLISLPPELLSHITSYLSPISLSYLSSTCTTLHTAVHHAWVARLSQQSSLYPAVRASLDRIDWNKDHDEWGCECSQLVAGPWLCWPRLARSEVTVEEDSNVNVGVGCAVASNRVFLCPKARAVHYRHRERLSEHSGGVLVELDLPEYNRYPLNVTQHHNTLIVKALESHPGYRRGDYKIIIFNSDTLNKVGVLDATKNIRDAKSLSELEIGDIAMCDDVIAVHLMFDVNMEINDIYEEVDIANIRENETQLWTIRTKQPKFAELQHVRTIKHSLALCSLLDPGLMSVNNQFITRIGTPTAFNLNQIQWFKRTKKWSKVKGGIKLDYNDNENEVASYLPVSVMSQHDYNRASVRIASLGGGNSEYISVGLELGIDHRDRDHSYLILVQVYHLTRGEIVLEQEFGTTNHIDEKIKMSWFGPHLLILSREKSTSSLYSWQPGHSSFMVSPCKVQVGSVHWGIDWIWADFEGLVTTNVNFGLEQTIIQTYHPVQRLFRDRKMKDVLM